MEINWPENLIEEIAYDRVVFFIGAGISATARNDQEEAPMRWKEFLEAAIALIDSEKVREIEFIREMISQSNYLLALQAIYDSCDHGEYARFIRSSYSRPNYKASVTHELMKEIGCKIVVTTNFDKIYENLCNEHGYTVAQYTETKKILANLKSTENLIIKAHGTVDDVDNMVFTQRQYYDAKKNHPQFYEVLKALFLTKTVIFLGYSMNDPDINLILETVANTSSPSSPNYIVMKQNESPPEIKKYWKECFNIWSLEYGPNYEDLELNLVALTDKVLAEKQKISNIGMI